MSNNDLTSLLERIKEDITPLYQDNIFDIMDMYQMEIKHSKVLAWLLDANASHNLDDYFVKSFFSNAFSNDSKKSLFDSFDWNSFKVITEYSFVENGNKNYIDISLKSKKHKTIIVIENKVTADLGTRIINGEPVCQLDIYYEKITEKDKHNTEKDKHNTEKDEHNTKKYNHYTKYFILLAPNVKERFSDKLTNEVKSGKNWIMVDYNVILQSLPEDIINSLSGKKKYLIQDYEKIIKRIIMELDKNEKDKYLNLCNEYRTELNYIYENIKRKDIVAFSINKALNKHKNTKIGNIEIVTTENTNVYFRFTTIDLSKAVGEKKVGENLYFEIHNEDGKTIRLNVIVCMKNNNEIVKYLAKKYLANDSNMTEGSTKSLESVESKSIKNITWDYLDEKIDRIIFNFIEKSKDTEKKLLGKIAEYNKQKGNNNQQSNNNQH